MFASALITFREGLEAALIVGIVIGYLVKSGHHAHIRAAWLGIGLAALASVVLAGGIALAGAELQGAAEAIFEGTIMFIAVGVLTWMIFWMRKQARLLKTSLETEMRQAIQSGAAWGVFSIAFLSVFREGVETALFFGASAFLADAVSALMGATLGLVAAVVVGYLIYASTVRLNTRWFFNITSVLLLFFAAGLLAHGVHEFQEASWLPTLIPRVWNTNFLLNEQTLLGSLMKAMFGYNSTPSLLELITYATYWVVTLIGVRWWVDRQVKTQTTPMPA